MGRMKLNLPLEKIVLLQKYSAALASKKLPSGLNQNMASPFLARLSQLELDHIFTSASGMRKSNGDIDLDGAGSASFPFK